MGSGQKVNDAAFLPRNPLNFECKQKKTGAEWGWVGAQPHQPSHSYDDEARIRKILIYFFEMLTGSHWLGEQRWWKEMVSDRQRRMLSLFCYRVVELCVNIFVSR